MPPAWRRWLADQGSLTRRLIIASNNRFSVNLLRQSYGRPTPSEAAALGMSRGRYGLIREVILLGNEVPWVYARSVLPLPTLTGRQRALRQLDNRPLGALLFADRGMTRDPLEIARVSGALIPGGLASPDTVLWGRRSVFYLDHKPLLVSEIFLPAFNPYNVQG